MGVFMTFLIAAYNVLAPPATTAEAATIRVIGCFYAGWGIGQCLRLIYPEE